MRSKILIKNYFYLLTTYGANILIPLISYPIIISKIGLNFFGEIVYVQAFFTIINIAVTFGTGFSSVKTISKYSSNKKIVKNTIVSTYLIKFFVLSFFILLMLLVNEIFNLFKYPILIFYGIGFISFELLIPTFYYLGLERMKTLNYLNLISKLFYLFCIFFLLEKDIFYYVPFYLLIGNFLIFIPILITLLKKYNNLRLPNKFFFLSFVKRSFYLLIGNFMIVLYVNTNKIVIGSFLGVNSLAYYDIAEKISIATKLPIQLVSKALFPFFSKRKNLKNSAFILKILLVCSIVYTAIICFMGPLMLKLMGVNQLESSLFVFYILSLSIPFVLSGIYFIDLGLVIDNKLKDIITIRVKTLILYIIFLLIYLLTCDNYIPEIFALIYLISEIYVSGISYLKFQKLNLK